MSTTLTRPVIDRGRTTSGLRLEPMGHRRRPALAVGSLALVVVCVAVFVSIYVKAGNEQTALAVARAVPEGQVLKADDLVAVRVSISADVAWVPAGDAATVVGRRAAEALEPNSLLTTSELVSSYSPPAGDSIVGVALKEGQLPASGVSPGETVDVVLTGLPGEQDLGSVDPDTTTDQGSTGATPTATAPADSAGTVLVPGATVLEAMSSPTSSGSGDIDVSLLTASTLAPVVASASAAGQVALVVVAPGS